MDELRRIHSSFDHLQSPPVQNNYHVHQFNDFGQSDDIMGGGSDHNILDILKDQISNHPLYPNLVSAYIDCRKVGAPPETATLLEEISKENHHVTSPYEVGVDPELDQFMESYCGVLMRYKEMLSKPLDESTAFFSNIVSQLNELCKENITNTTTSSFTSTNYHSVLPGEEEKSDPPVDPTRGRRLNDWLDEAAGGTSDEEIIFDIEAAPEADQESTHESSGHGGEENELKETLMRKYSGYLSSLRKEFLKKRKKGKLPKKATNALLDWWNTHYRWPYPTEEEKTRLSEQTGLDQKQINNWFINQRKRHWRPSEDMRFALMQGFTRTNLAPPPPMYHDVAGGGVAGNYGGTTAGNYESPS